MEEKKAAVIKKRSSFLFKLLHQLLPVQDHNEFISDISQILCKSSDEMKHFKYGDSRIDLFCELKNGIKKSVSCDKHNKAR